MMCFSISCQSAKSIVLNSYYIQGIKHGIVAKAIQPKQYYDRSRFVTHLTIIQLRHE